MFRIGEFSKLAKTTVKTVRFYDEIDLFKPSYVDENGYRYYSIEDLNKLNYIIFLRKLELPIDDIKEILIKGNFKEVLKRRIEEIEYTISNNQNNLALIKKLIICTDGGDLMKKYSAKLEVIPKSVVYYRHGIIDSMGELANFVLEAGKECLKANPTLKCKNYCYVTYAAKEYQEKNVEIEYVEAVEKKGIETEQIKFKEIPEIKAICVSHKGDYAGLPEAYAYALSYIKEKKYLLNGDIREVYIHGCWDRENVEEYLTEIQIPIK